MLNKGKILVAVGEGSSLVTLSMVYECSPAASTN